MADIGINGVTYARVEGTQKASPSDPRYQAVYNLTFGNATDTYPTGGVPLVAGRLGCPTKVEEFIIMDAADNNGFIYKWDSAANKVRVYQGDNDAGADGALVELAGGVATPAAATIQVKVVGW